MGFLTDSIHAGQPHDPTTGAVTTPIYQTSTYAHTELGAHRGWSYGRGHNPTREALERNIAALERGRHGVTFGSGMAAIHACLSLLDGGDHVVATRSIYGGSYRLFTSVLERFGLRFTYVDTSDLAALEGAMTDATKLVYIESPTNPLMTITDIAAAARIAHGGGARLCVDNTFLSPYLQRPLTLGADLVVHSTTKYLNGHSDSVGGIVVVDDDELRDRLSHLRLSVGAILGPFDSWLVLRGTKTLGLRMRRHNDSALAIARWLAGRSEVDAVYYPGLTSHPQHELARTQQSGFGGMITIDCGRFAAAEELLNGLRLWTLAESLGGVESLACHPATMTYGGLAASDRTALGITEGLVRLSVGCEDTDDLIADLERAMSNEDDVQ